MPEIITSLLKIEEPKAKLEFLETFSLFLTIQLPSTKDIVATLSNC